MPTCSRLFIEAILACTMSPFHMSPLLVFLIAFFYVQCAFTQYSGGGYRKNQQANSKMPIEMMLFGAPSMSAQKDGYSNGMTQFSPSPKSRYGDQMSRMGTSGKMPYEEMAYEGTPIRAAVKSTHTVEHRDVPTEPLNIKPQTILVEAMNIPLNILFQSKSSNLNLKSEHIASQGSTQETESEDEPHILKHSVTKPIIQEIYELITPFRFIKQEIAPVKEEITTLVARQVPNENKYEAVNAPRYGSMGQQIGSRSYGGQEQALSRMMEALKMEIPKQFLQMSGYRYQQPMKPSRMQMYMNQLRQQQEQPEQPEQPEQQEQPEEPILDQAPQTKTDSNKSESLQSELADPDLKEEASPASTESELALDNEKDVSLDDDNSTQAPEMAVTEKLPSKDLIMIYGGISSMGDGSKSNAKSLNGAAKIGLVQQSFLSSGNSPKEPTGY